MQPNVKKTKKKQSSTTREKKQSPGTKKKTEAVEEFEEDSDEEMEDKVSSKIKDSKNYREVKHEDDSEDDSDNSGSDDGDEEIDIVNKKRKKASSDTVPIKKVKTMAKESIFLGGLNKDTTHITIKNFFKSHGVKIVDIRKKQKKRFGHCDLASEEDVEKAVQLNNSMIDGASVQIAIATGQRPVLNYGIHKRIKPGKRTVVVKNLSYKVTEDDLLDLFKDSIAARMPKFTDSGKSRGKGFVDFPDALSARNAVNNMNCSKLHGRRIFVDFAPESGKNLKSGPILHLNQPEKKKKEVKAEFAVEEF